MTTLASSADAQLAEPSVRGSDLESARRADQAAVAAFRLAESMPSVMVVRAVAGAGKTELVTDLAARLAEGGESVIVATCTREQAAEVCERLVLRNHVPRYTQGRGSPVPLRIQALAGDVQLETDGANLAPVAGRITVGNNAKVAHIPPGVPLYDVMIVDEAFQLRAAEFLPSHTVARRWLLVGDPAQLAPFTPLADPGFQHSAASQSAARSVLDRVKDAPVVDLPISRRLPASTVRLVGPAFYPGMDVAAYTKERTRRLIATPVSPAALRALDHGSVALAELPGAPAADIDRALLERAAETATGAIGHVIIDELGARCLKPNNVAVLAARHTDVSVLQRSLLGSGIHATTFNRAQGRTFDLVVVVDPLATVGGLTNFAIDPGRLAVALTRHRVGAVMLSRRGVRSLLEGHPADPSGPEDLYQSGMQRALALHESLRR